MPRRRPFRRLFAASAHLLTGARSPASPLLADPHSPLDRAARDVSRAMLNGYGIEPLEQRIMLIVLGGAGTNGQAEYFNNSGGQIRVAWHDMTFQVIDATVPTGSAQAFESDPVPISPTAPTVVPNIYAIYVLQSSLDSWISIAQVPSLTTMGDRAMTPFGAAPTINVNDTGLPPSTTLIPAPIGTDVGSVLLGAVTATTTNAGLPILSIANTMYPASGPYFTGSPTNPNPITPGLYMSPIALNATGGAITGPGGLDVPNDLGRFFFGGVITGDVNIPAPTPGSVPAAPASQGGNVGVFYAGSILTGDATGIDNVEGLESASSLTTNFFVGGDIRDLITGGGIGGGRGAATRADQSQYSTGLRMVVAGSVGEINSRTGGFYGSLDVQHLSSIYGLPNNLFDEHELEAEDQFVTPEPGAYFGPVQGAVEPASLTGYPLLPSDFFSNDTTPTSVATEGTAQYLGSIRETNPDTGLPLTDANGNSIYYAFVDGDLEGDAPNPETTDNYALPLLAGQSITPTLTLTGSANFQDLTLTLVDPDGRIVATSNVESTARQLTGETSTPFQYTADRPGVYTLVVTQLVLQNVTLTIPYHLNVTGTGVGNMSLAALVVGGGDIIDNGATQSFEVDNGDAGIFQTPAGFSVASLANTGQTLAAKQQEAATIEVPAGSLRTVKAGQLGISIADGGGGIAPEGPFGVNGAFGSEPVLGVPAGSVGLLETLDTTGFLAALTPFDSLNAANVAAAAFVVPTVPIGGNVQMIDGAGAVFLDLATNQGIGDILAGNMATNTASFIDVNADNAGNDGIIDLIDDAGDLGTVAAGGPAILTNTGGYVRYMRVSGAINQDRFFGNPFSSTVLGSAGQTLTYTEDTGAALTFTPTGLTTTTTVTDAGVTNTTTNGPSVTLTVYGIRDKGGGVILDATATNGSVTITAKGGSGSPSENVANLSQIQFTANSSTTVGFTTNALGNTVLDANGEPVLSTPTTVATAATTGTTTTTGTDTAGNVVTTTTTVSGSNTTSSLTINGSASVDILNINVLGTGVVNSIANNTPNGEIDNLEDLLAAGSIVSLSSAGTLGMIQSHTGALVTTSTGNATAPLFTSANTFPFDLQTTGIYVFGNVLSIRAAGGLGNINVVGNIGSIVANTNGSAAGGFAGINAPILAGASGDTPSGLAAGAGGVVYAATGNIESVSIGQGILPSGTGTTFSRAGLYAEGDIGSVTNNNRAQADIRGTIDVGDKLDRVTLGNASIIGALVGSIFPFSAAQAHTQATLEGLNLGQLPTTFSVGQIVITGRGGIIGSDIAAYNGNRISVGPQGFGIIDSTIEGTAGGVFNQIIAGGYGIRDSDLMGGGSFNTINATGNGSQLPVTAFGTDVRQSETLGFDAYSGEALTAANDLDAALGTSAGVATIAGSTDTGVLQDDSIQATGTLGSISAQTIRTAEPINVLLEDEPEANIPRPGQTFGMQINVIGTVGAVNVRGTIDGLELTTGNLRAFHEHGSVSRLGISVAGTIQNLMITGNYGQLITDPGTGALIPDSYIQATGSQGTINNLTIDGNLNAPVTANVAIRNMTVLGNVVGSISALGHTTGLTLGTLRISGALKDGSLTIDGPAGSIIANAGLGDSTGTITVSGSLNMLEVGAAHARGSTLASAVDVTGTLGKLIVNGSITGALTVGGDLTTMRVTGDGASPNIVSAPITVGGRIYTATLADGNIASDITANGFVRNFTLRSGDVLSTSTIASQLDAIQNFRITGGTGFGLFGSLDAPNGANGSVYISGNLGDGTDAASIIEGSGKQFHILGSILANTDITISAELAQLLVNGNIAAGATISAHPLAKLTVRGTNAGEITQS